MPENKTIISYAKIIAKPWVHVCYLLAGLLVISTVANYCLATREHNITIEQENSYSDFNENGIVE